jgi:hypothetical protein
MVSLSVSPSQSVVTFVQSQRVPGSIDLEERRLAARLGFAAPTEKEILGRLDAVVQQRAAVKVEERVVKAVTESKKITNSLPSGRLLVIGGVVGGVDGAEAAATAKAAGRDEVAKVVGLDADARSSMGNEVDKIAFHQAGKEGEGAVRDFTSAEKNLADEEATVPAGHLRGGESSPADNAPDHRHARNASPTRSAARGTPQHSQSRKRTELAMARKRAIV